MYLRKYTLFAMFFVMAATGPIFAQGETTATGLSRAFNPSIGANGLFIASYSDHSSLNSEDFQTGLRIQEVEFALMSVVDPYLRVQLTLSIPGMEGIEVEEGYVQTTSLPRGLGLQVGKFHLPFGKQNRLHTHAFPFIDAPWISSALMADDGLDEVGFELNYLASLPWFSEVAFVVYDPKGGSPFVQRTPQNMGYLANFRNLWDINRNTTFELGFSGTTAKTSWEEMARLSLPPGLQETFADDLEQSEQVVGDLYILGTDATVKHVSTHYHGWDVSVEYIQGLGVFDRFIRTQYGGITGYGRFQVSRRWWIQSRGDVLGLPLRVPQADTDGTLERGQTPWRISEGIAFVPSEFTAIRLQYDYADRITETPETRVMLQLNVTFGAHPAHSY